MRIIIKVGTQTIAGKNGLDQKKIGNMSMIFLEKMELKERGLLFALPPAPRSPQRQECGSMTGMQSFATN